MALRSLLKNRLYSFLSIGGFAIGFAVCIIIGLFVYGEYTVDSGFKDHGRIYRLIDTKNNTAGIDYELSKVLTEHYPDIEYVAPYALDHYEYKLSVEDKYYSVFGLMSTTNEFFNLFSLSFISKSSDNPFANENSIIITESLAKKTFGTDNPIGKTITLDYEDEYIISAVLADMPNNTSMSASLFINAENEDNRFAYSCHNNDCYNPMGSYIKLHQGVNSTEFTEKINSTISEFQDRYDNLSLQSLSDIYLFSDLLAEDKGENISGNQTLINLLLFIAILILILSIINYINYSIAQHHSQLKIIGVRKANGASTRNIFKYFLSESFIGVAIAAMLSIGIAFIFIPFANDLFNKEIQFSLTSLTFPISILFIIFLIIILINSFLPQFRFLRYSIIPYLKGGQISKGKSLSSSILTVFQFTIAICLLVSLLFINKQLSYVKHSDLGFQKENLLYIDLPYNSDKIAGSFKSEIDNLSFVNSSSLSRGIPGIINSTQGYNVNLSNGEKKLIKLRCIYADMDFLETYNIGLKQGRKILQGDLGKTCLINETAMREHEWSDLDGKRLYNFGTEGGTEVIGIINDFHFASFHQSIEPFGLVLWNMQGENAKKPHQLSLKIAPGNLTEQIKQIKSIWSILVPDRPMEIKFVDNMLNSMYQTEERLGKTIFVFSMVAFLLIYLGILGQVYHNCINKTKEIGVRKVNGAKLIDIFRILNIRFIILMFLAYIISLPISYYAISKWLEGFAYKTILSWWVFALAGIGTLIFVITIVTLQSLRTARRNPVLALRYE
jgi:putative ABC transport system permease protein